MTDQHNHEEGGKHQHLAGDQRRDQAREKDEHGYANRHASEATGSLGSSRIRARQMVKMRGWCFSRALCQLDHLKGLRQGDYVAKPFSTSEVLAFVEGVIASFRTCSESL